MNDMIVTCAYLYTRLKGNRYIGLYGPEETQIIMESNLHELFCLYKLCNKH